MREETLKKKRQSKKDRCSLTSALISDSDTIAESRTSNNLITKDTVKTVLNPQTLTLKSDSTTSNLRLLPTEKTLKTPLLKKSMATHSSVNYKELPILKFIKWISD